MQERAVHSAKETRRTGFDEILENAAAEAKMYPVALPSRLEQQYMAAARLRQRDNIVTKQVPGQYDGWGVHLSLPLIVNRPLTLVDAIHLIALPLVNAAFA